MTGVLRDLRAALTHELALFGPFVPLGDEPAPPAKVASEAPRRIEVPVPTPAADPPTDAATDPPTDAATDPDDAFPDSDAAMANQDLFGNEIDPRQDPSRSPYERIEALIPAGSPLHGFGTLDEVRDYAQNTILIPLDEARINTVFGVGDPEADLMVVGEAPGADEDRQGEPFVGRAGQLLNKILQAIHFERQDVYITNILKSRPPNNRDPLPEEVEAHLPLLYKQIALIRPKVILCVGKTAGNSLLDRKSSLGALRDRFHDFHGLPLLVTYHPAALLRNPQWKRPTWEDMKLLRTRYDQLTGS